MDLSQILIEINGHVPKTIKIMEIATGLSGYVNALAFSINVWHTEGNNVDYFPSPNVRNP